MGPLLFSGLHQRAIVIESHAGTHLVSARLHPLGAFRLLGPLAATLVNQVVDLNDLLGPAAGQLRALLLAADSPEQRFIRIEEAHGNLRIAAIPYELGVSRKQLWLRLRQELSLSPKAYAQLQRFVWTLARLSSRRLCQPYRVSPSALPDSTALLDEVG